MTEPSIHAASDSSGPAPWRLDSSTAGPPQSPSRDPCTMVNPLPVRRATACVIAACPLERAAYRALLETRLGLPIIAESDLEPAAVLSALRTQPRLVFIFEAPDPPSTLDVVTCVVRIGSHSHMIVVAQAAYAPLQDLWRRGAIACYLSKRDGLAELRAGTNTLLSGGRCMSERFHRTAPTVGEGLHHRLSPREGELLGHLARGLRLREAAARMSVSYKTADSHRTRLLQKLGLKNRVELARYAIRQKLIEA